MTQQKEQVRFIRKTEQRRYLKMKKSRYALIGAGAGLGVSSLFMRRENK